MTKRASAPIEYVQPYRYKSPDIPMSAIKRFARRIAAKFHPDKIILFGSYAYGTPHNESDVDLLVIMPCRNVIDQAIRIDRAFERPFSFDLIVRTPYQIRLGLKQDDRDWFLWEITEKGKVLYEAPNGPVGLRAGEDVAAVQSTCLYREAIALNSPASRSARWVIEAKRAYAEGVAQSAKAIKKSIALLKCGG